MDDPSIKFISGFISTFNSNYISGSTEPTRIYMISLGTIDPEINLEMNMKINLEKSQIRMSFREMRTFTEMMRSLGFPRIISMENFRSPNFPLVAEILCWLVTRYDVNADIAMVIDTEQDRIIFVKTIALFMATKAHIRLNTKKIYQADGYAVKEMLKITTLLYNAMRHDPMDDDQLETSVLDVFDMTRVKELKEARQLSSQITSRGAKLYDLLKREVDLREIRQTAIGRQLEITEVERGVRYSSSQITEEIQRIVKALENIAADEANLEAKVQKKQNELDRNRKRLSTLQSVRPAYMDEYEELERDLDVLYRNYLNRFRNLAYFEAQYEDQVQAEKERNEETQITMKHMADQLRDLERSRVSQKKDYGADVDNDEDDFRGLLDEDDGDDSTDDDDDDEDDDDDLETHEVTRGGVGGMGLMRTGGAGDRPLQMGRDAGRSNGAEYEEDDEVTDIDDEDDDDTDEDDEDESDIDNEMATNNAAMRPAASRSSARPTGAGSRKRPQVSDELSDGDF